MSKLQNVLTVGDLRAKLEGVDDSVELTVLMDDYKHWPLQGCGIHYSVKDTETLERTGPDVFGLYPVTKGHITANFDEYSDTVKDKVAAVENICKCPADIWDWRTTKEASTV